MPPKCQRNSWVTCTGQRQTKTLFDSQKSIRPYFDYVFFVSACNGNSCSRGPIYRTVSIYITSHGRHVQYRSARTKSGIILECASMKKCVDVFCIIIFRSYGACWLLCLCFSMKMTPQRGFAINCFNSQEHSSSQPTLKIQH